MLPSQTGVGESHFPSMHWLLFEPRNINPSSHQNWTLLWCWILSPNIKPFAGRVWGWHGAKRSKKKKTTTTKQLFWSSNFFSCDFFCGFCYTKQIWYNFGWIFVILLANNTSLKRLPLCVFINDNSTHYGNKQTFQMLNGGIHVRH